MSRLLTRAWYGGPAYDPPPEPPPATTEGGAPPPTLGAWAQALKQRQAVKGPRAGDALVLGRFLPLHTGHVHLFTRALEAVSGALHVVVATRANDFLGPRARTTAVTESVVPERRGAVLTADDVGQQGEPEDDDFWKPWLEWVQAQPKLAACTTLVAGDPRAERFAQLLKKQFVLVSRDEFRLSGTQVRTDPWPHWDDIAPNLRAAFAGSVALVGPEGAGKSTLASQLGKHYGTSVAHEYLPTFLQAEARQEPSREQLQREVWDGTRSAWSMARERARRFFIGDTDQLTVSMWASRLFGTPLTTEPERPGFTLLLDDASPWKGPANRDQPEARRQFVEEFRRLLVVRGTPHAFITGPREGRFSQAVAHLERWIKTRPMAR